MGLFEKTVPGKSEIIKSCTMKKCRLKTHYQMGTQSVCRILTCREELSLSFLGGWRFVWR